MELLAWGANSYGQLGLGFKSEQVLTPTLVVASEENLNSKNIHSISAGAGHTLILTKNGLVYCCGWNSKGQLGIEKEILVFTEISILNKYKIIRISCGWDFSAAIADEGILFVWGSNSFSQLGLAKNIKQISSPYLVQNIHAKQISCGLRHMAILKSDGKVMVCGSGSKGQLGLINEYGKSIRESDLKNIPHLEEIISISCGQFHTLALQSNGTLYGWGNNKHGQLGLNPEKYPEILTPSTIYTNKIPYEVYTGWTHSVILTKNGEIFNFGRNSYQQLGCQRSNFWEPGQIKGKTFLKFCSGAEHNLAISSNDKLFCWGWNEHGNCGTGDTEDVAQPTEICINGTAIFIACGTGQSFAIVEKNEVVNK